MTDEEQLFLKRLLATFRIEAEEHLNAMSSSFLKLEQSESSTHTSSIVETLFREAHSLKGAARSVNLKEVEAVCQVLESILSSLQKHELPLSSAFFSLMSSTVDGLKNMISASVVPATDASSSMVIQSAALIRALESLQGLDQSGLARKRVETVKAADTGITGIQDGLSDKKKKPLETFGIDGNDEETVRISTKKLNALMVQTEELLSFKFSSRRMAENLRALYTDMVLWDRAWKKSVREVRGVRRSLRAPVAGGYDGLGGERYLMRMIESFKQQNLFFKTLSDHVLQMEKIAEQEWRTLAGMVDNLLEDTKQALMLPFSSILELLPSLVRNMARDSGKRIELLMEGETLEIDRRILEQMKDPLLHLIRNAIDHGIEEPDERIRKGKTAHGCIVIQIVPRNGSKIEVSVFDDGRGIDIERVANRAQQLGLTDSDKLSGGFQKNMVDLIFESGLSTSPIVTDISGRGLGLAIVREKVEKLGGSIHVDSSASGTRFCILFPTTLTTFRGLLIRIGKNRFVLPSSDVQRVARIAIHDVKMAESHPTIVVENTVFALISLNGLLEIATSQDNDATTEQTGKYLSVVILESGGRQIAFTVDEILGDEEILVKSLGPQLVRVPNIAGATVIGPGYVVPILNVTDLIKTALKRNNAVSILPNSGMRESFPQKRSILVAEDSITSRLLLRNMLELAGYTVTAVVDGVEALAELRNGKFDAVVSDVEMPRMDGFSLTANIRSNKLFSDLPVILVTALDSREHKERGVEVGANAYIVKSNFEQSNLLDVLRSLT